MSPPEITTQCLYNNTIEVLTHFYKNESKYFTQQSQLKLVDCT